MASKSILKETSRDGNPDSKAMKAAQKAREVATHHAEILQQQKDVQSDLFKSMLELIEMPSSRTSDPGHPDKADITTMRIRLELFQTSDFEELIDERKANGQCGYVLCPRRHRVKATTAQFRVLTRIQDQKLSRREDLDAWCSNACAKRAMYIQAQIPQEPAWTRAVGNTHLTISPLVEEKIGMHLPLRLKSSPSKLGGQEDAAAEALRRERGDTRTSFRGGDVVMTEAVQETELTTQAEPPMLGQSDEASNAIEGFAPRDVKGLRK